MHLNYIISIALLLFIIKTTTATTRTTTVKTTTAKTTRTTTVKTTTVKTTTAKTTRTTTVKATTATTKPTTTATTKPTTTATTKPTTTATTTGTTVTVSATVTTTKTATTTGTAGTCKPNEYWNGVNCVSKLYKYFYTSNYTVRQITQYNGVNLTYLNAVKVQHSPQYSIYASNSVKYTVRFDQFGNSLENNNYMGGNLMTVVENGSIYGTDPYVGTTNIYEFSQKLALINTKTDTSPYANTRTGIKYDSQSGLLYVSDGTYNLINAYDLSLNRIPSATINLTTIAPGDKPYAIQLYRTPTATYIYIALFLGKIIVVDLSTKTKISELLSGCATSRPFDLLIDQNSNYLLVACANDNYIALWETNGVTHTNTNKVLMNGASCRNLDYDQYGRLYVASDNIITIYE